MAFFFQPSRAEMEKTNQFLFLCCALFHWEQEATHENVSESSSPSTVLPCNY